ncbi:hypothetical protein [Aeromicrobium sp.]|uniref:hypothetical protein n=1 Tax=Aeromicrobium sp. TaxID=1871063 RepID=UPI003D6B7A39
MERTASILSWILGLGFGLPAVYGAWFFARHGEIWTLFGFPAYGDGPFERMGIPTSVPLMAAFATVCAAECITGWLMWSGAPAGWWMAVLLLPVEAVFWIGFALPFGPPLGVARAALALLTWP